MEYEQALKNWVVEITEMLFKVQEVENAQYYSDKLGDFLNVQGRSVVVGKAWTELLIAAMEKGIDLTEAESVNKALGDVTVKASQAIDPILETLDQAVTEFVSSMEFVQQAAAELL